MYKIPRRVLRCVTHYYGCNCREWLFEKALETLTMARSFMDDDDPQQALAEINNFFNILDELKQ